MIQRQLSIITYLDRSSCCRMHVFLTQQIWSHFQKTCNIFYILSSSSRLLSLINPRHTCLTSALLAPPCSQCLSTCTSSHFRPFSSSRLSCCHSVFSLSISCAPVPVPRSSRVPRVPDLFLVVVPQQWCIVHANANM